MASGFIKKVDPHIMLSKLRTFNSLTGAIFPSYFQERTYQTDTKVKVVNARPLKITRIREKKVLLDTPTKPLVKERDLIDRSEEVNVYKQYRRDIPEDKALETLDFFKVKEKVDLYTLFKNRVHYGHHPGCRHPFISRYLYGVRHDTDIFDLEKTLPRLRHALNFVAHVVYRGGMVLFVSRNAQHMPLVEQTAQRCGEYSHCRFWRGGLFTNMDFHFRELTRLPDVVIFIHAQNNFGKEHVAITECADMMIPSVGIVDSNCNPTFITYPIPGNDDSPDAVNLYCKLFEDIILLAKENRKRDVEEISEDILSRGEKEKDSQNQN